MSQEGCSVSLCTKTGTLLCTGCMKPQARYCSKECQKRDWKSHKLSCAAAQKRNCFLIRASDTSLGTSDSNFADCIEPLHLVGYGTESGERAELKTRLGWAGAEEVGKFYGHDGADNWYYYVYGPWTPEGNAFPKNGFASLCIGRDIFGDVALVRSGPMDSNNYASSFTKTDLMKTVEYYQSANPTWVFGERERTRFMRKLGLEGVHLG